MPRRDEPLTITTEIVVQELRRLGYERMAGFVHRLGDGVARAERRVQWAQEDVVKLVERLHKYEPPAPPAEHRNYRSPPESDG